MSRSLWKIHGRTGVRTRNPWITDPMHSLLCCLGPASDNAALQQTSLLFEPQHDKTNKTPYAPSEDWDQPGHPPSLISLHCGLKECFFMRTAKTDQTRWCPGWSDLSPQCAQVILLVCHAQARLNIVYVTPSFNFTRLSFSCIGILSCQLDASGFLF